MKRIYSTKRCRIYCRIQEIRQINWDTSQIGWRGQVVIVCWPFNLRKHFNCKTMIQLAERMKTQTPRDWQDMVQR